MRVFCLHNPDAGRGDPSPDQLQELIRRAGHEVVYRSSGEPDWIEALEEGLDLCVAAGGDGTVGKLARELAGRPVPITVLPLGTANNIATALGIRDAPLEGLVDGWRDAIHRPFDLGVAIGPWGTTRFLESVGIGLLAESMARIDSGRAGNVNGLAEPDAQLAAAREACQAVLRTLEPIPAELTTRGARVTMRCLLLEVMNFGAAGPRLQLTPGADAHDGLLDVVALEDHQRPEIRDLLARASPPSARALGVQRVAALELEFPATVVHIDDRVWRAEESPGRVRLELGIEPGALTVLVPQVGPTTSRNSTGGE